MSTISVYAVVFLTWFLVSCQSVQPYDENSRFYQVPVNSHLVLNKSVVIAPNLARAYFQYGQPVAKQAIEKYQPHCYLLLRTLSEQEQVIQPDTFIINQVQRDFIVSANHTFYASLVMDSLDPSLVEYVNIYSLSSTRQPQVMSLNCLQWGQSVDRLYPSVAEVRQALGAYFTLQLDGIDNQKSDK